MAKERFMNPFDLPEDFKKQSTSETMKKALNNLKNCTPSQRVMLLVRAGIIENDEKSIKDAIKKMSKKRAIGSKVKT